MSGISKSSLGMAVACLFVSAMMLLAPTEEASAQINIEGIIRGALSHGYRSRGGGSHHSRSHSSSRRDRDDSDSANSDKGKDKDALDEEAASKNSGGDSKPDAKLSRRGPSAPSHDAAQASDASATAAAKPSGTAGEEPSFAPSR